jgi:hypothetical protein
MVWNTGPENEQEGQSAIISFVNIIIRKEYVLRQQYHFKKANFSRRQNVLLIVISKLFQPSKVTTKIYIFYLAPILRSK